MALGTNNTTAAVAGNFIPELWSDEVIGAYKSNLVVANLVTSYLTKVRKVILFTFLYQREEVQVLKQQIHK